ncbi:conjugal transfer protein TraD [Novosphingobium sp. PC22D]|uniref:type IV secretion system DNA-binding domain-containing protein n=1 Tax=Novosphingobium sp. PC22D TaxID=1962403 RepID=UPI000BF078A1|nr:type IV secretion system DNA-binding domain-containing protein [Novosphingobium sp. PC22D]PEQ10783.1 conjugal transfer protein TraD [Novosphingobium sp. PC22D]
MKRNLVNFTRGSQLLGHFGFMFAAGLKGPVIIALVVLSWTSWWMISSQLSDHETYLAWMRIYAGTYTFMEFDPEKLVAIRTALGGSIEMPIAIVHKYPPVLRAWDHLTAILASALWRASLGLVPAFALFYWFAARFGSKSKARKHERGAQLVTLPELAQEIAAYNREERDRERDAALGWRWRLTAPSELTRVLPYRPSHLAGVAYPWRLEQSHAMLIGTTGMGKTVAMGEMVEEARARGQRCVIFDLTGAYIEHFFDASRDVILNPLDARCPVWSLFADCRTEGEFWSAAEALVPHDGGGEAQFWVIAARALFVEFCLKLVAQGQGSNAALADQLMTADLAKVHAMMRGTIADPLTAPEAARMAESIRAVFNVNAKALKLLSREGRTFSMRDWIAEGDETAGSFVFISARYVDMSVCSQLLTLWLDTAMNTLMALDRSSELRLWFFIDELGALHRLPALEKGLQTARNYGGAIVTGIHAYAKLKEVYGENMAMTLSSLARTKLILGTADRETATWCSDFIGHRQVRDMEEGYTYGFNNARDAVSLTPRKHIEPLLLPDQLMNLSRLRGYIKFPDGFPAAPIRLTPVSRPKLAEPFIGRAQDRPSARAADIPGAEEASDPARPVEGNAHPASNDDGVGKPTVPKQAEFDLHKARPGKAEQTEIEGQGRADDIHPKDTRMADPKASGHTDDFRHVEENATGKPDRPPLAPREPGKASANPKGEEQVREAQLARRSDLPKSSPGEQPCERDPRRVAQRRMLFEDGLPEQADRDEAVRDLGDFEIEP